MIGLLLATLASAQTIPAGADIEDAISVQITEEGLDSFGQLLPALAASEFPVDDNNVVSGMVIGLNIGEVDMTPRPALLEVDVELLINVNDSGDPYTLHVPGWLGGNCNGWVRPFPVLVNIPMALTVVQDPATGDRYIDATIIGDVAIDNQLDSEHLEFTGGACGIVDDIDDVLNAIGWSPIDFILSVINPILEGVVASQTATIEEALEDALRNVRYEDTVSFSDAELDVLVEPYDVDISGDGIEIQLLGNIDTTADPCIAAHDPGGSTSTPSGVPRIDNQPAGTQLVAHISDEFADQGLYAVWRSGLLCYSLEEGSGVDIGIPINNSLLGILGGEAFDEILPEEERPLSIKTDPRMAPTIDWDAGNDMVVDVRDLGVDFYTEIDFRQTRALGLTIEADVPVDLVFDDQTGLLQADIGLGADNIHPFASHNELAPSATEEIEDSVTGLLDVLVDSLVGDALSGVEFGLPAFSGVGLSDLSVSPSGTGDWGSVYAELGPVTYGGDGGGCDGGCGGSTGGCSSAASGGLFGFLLVAPLVAVRRRRR